MTNRTELIQILPIQSGLLMELTDFFTSRKQTKQPLQDARKEAMFAELHSLLSSGLDFSRSFSLLIEGERNAAGRALLTELYRSVVRGESLAARSSGANASPHSTAACFGSARRPDGSTKHWHSLPTITANGSHSDAWSAARSAIR